METFRIVIVDDHTLVRQGLKRIIGEMADLEVIGEAGDGLELLKLLEKITPHMILLDISMPNLRGNEAIRQIKALHPEVKILILSDAQRKRIPLPSHLRRRKRILSERGRRHGTLHSHRDDPQGKNLHLTSPLRRCGR